MVNWARLRLVSVIWPLTCTSPCQTWLCPSSSIPCGVRVSSALGSTHWVASHCAESAFKER
ncbi:Uncharacterised protein [Vibrio cholerae]|nr:Uncharacterised protein [Vibrio cholerae]